MFRLRILPGVVVGVLAAAAVALAVQPASAGPVFVTRNGAAFDLGGTPYRFGGANNYYLHYKSQLMVDDVFADAQQMGVKVIRAWTFLECGGDKPNSAGTSCDGQGPNVWMQRWSNASNSVVYNETATGLQGIDRMIASASAHGIKLLLPFAGNWRDFGGMDQYVTWYGLQFHDQFYTDARIKQDYKNWITKLLNRTNTVTGVVYKNDPTIFAWELGNEPRCINASLPTSGTCTADTLVNWATEMSAFIKGIDSNHMVSVGDEGFYNGAGCGVNAWPCNITDGVDNTRLTSISSIDFGTYHLYPAGWGQSNDWGTTWINNHNATGTTLNKPMILEEFGIPDQGSRQTVYTNWLNAVRTGGGDGWQVWILTGIQDDGQLYPDFDGFRVVLPSSDATLLANQAALINTVDTTPPSTPGTPTASGLTCTSVTLTWTASTDSGGSGLAGYNVYRRQGTTDTLIAQPTTNSVTLTNLAPSTSFTFVVRARDGAANLSNATAALAVTTPACPPDTTAPTTPGTPAVANVTSTAASLSWTASTDAGGSGLAGYNVYRRQGTTDTLLVQTTTNAAALTALTPSTAYQIVVRARDGANNLSAASGVASFTTLAPGNGGCTATYTQVGMWPGGFQGEVKVTNTSTTATTSWTVTLTFANGQTITQIWGGRTTQTASPYTVTPESWNAALAPNGTATFGFIGSQSGTNNPPTLACSRTP